MIDIITNPATWASLATLTLMEVVLGIDNIIFISILAGKLPAEQANRARLVGLAIACVTRLGLLLTISWLIGLQDPLFGLPFSGRDAILVAGGLFLIYKATREIHEKLEGEDEAGSKEKGKGQSFLAVVAQIVVLDIVFSLDSVLTAVGMAEHVEIMMAAVVVALVLMVFVGKAIGDFVMRHPTVKMLALAFLMLIGVTLVAEAFHREIPKAYIYSAMAFSVSVELLNLWVSKRRGKGKPVQLHQNVVG